MTVRPGPRPIGEASRVAERAVLQNAQALVRAPHPVVLYDNRVVGLRYVWCARLHDSMNWRNENFKRSVQIARTVSAAATLAAASVARAGVGFPAIGSGRRIS
jgi:hypothetical protein